MPGRHFFFFKKKKNLNFTPELTIVTFLFAKFYLAHSLNPPNFPLKQIREAPLNISGFLSFSFFLDDLLQGTSFACSSPAGFSLTSCRIAIQGCSSLQFHGVLHHLFCVGALLLGSHVFLFLA